MKSLSKGHPANSLILNFRLQTLVLWEIHFCCFNKATPSMVFCSSSPKTPAEWNFSNFGWSVKFLLSTKHICHSVSFKRSCKDKKEGRKDGETDFFLLLAPLDEAMEHTEWKRNKNYDWSIEHGDASNTAQWASLHIAWSQRWLVHRGILPSAIFTQRLARGPLIFESHPLLLHQPSPSHPESHSPRALLSAWHPSIYSFIGHCLSTTVGRAMGWKCKNK